MLLIKICSSLSLQIKLNIFYNVHSVKSVCIRSYSGPHFPALGMNTERCSVSLQIQSECGKIRTRITPNTDTFYAACYYLTANRWVLPSLGMNIWLDVCCILSCCIFVLRLDLIAIISHRQEVDLNLHRLLT